MAKSAKRGIAYDLSDPADLEVLSPGVSWWYNWSPQPNTGVPSDYLTQYQMDFYPMIWGANYNVNSVETYLQANPKIKYLLVMNEPNLTSQSNLTPQQAAALWPDGAQITTLAEQEAQMKDMVATCESRSDVFRYAWFTGRVNPDPHFSSILAASGQLTGLGQLYLTLPYTTAYTPP